MAVMKEAHTQTHGHKATQDGPGSVRRGGSLYLDPSRRGVGTLSKPRRDRLSVSGGSELQRGP